ncbi:MAG TPA: translation initiation factor IF-2 [Smithella sp.]|jgi:translation initiation factor IF-2|nr:translation initiation factor IF-2 [Smithella sp.]HOE32027.1 translation initiation factor IF-2 [Smithella sp.]HOG10464.1 translation initiation factor IF-2 [Smithella sp.]HOS14692.1 translation initiation factor IF-2 [Smithella sp.]HOX98265.1 translation initiation factor IF-2 [Smithella sp.]
MPKKRVYELAKELGMESKVLIARLEKIGISVKSASASLEEADAERAKKELTAGELREVVEQRIKTTVIRRRTVVTAVEKPPEEVPLEEAKPPEKEPAEDKLKKAPPGKTEKVKKEKPGEEPAVPAETVSEKAVKEVVPPAAVGPAAAETKASLEQKAAPLEKSAEEKAVKPETKEAPVAPVKPTIITKHKIIRPETGKAVPPKVPAAKPAEKISQPSAEKPKKKGKYQVEVLIEEEKKIPTKKILEKKIEKRLKRHEEDQEVVFTKWREGKKAAPTKMKKTEITVPKAIKRRIKIGETITVGELAKRMGIKVSEIINKLMSMGVMATINQAIDYDTASIVAGEFSFQLESADVEFDESVLKAPSTPENLKPRAPVVTIMGHVDHGKTSLLDAIRQTNVSDGETGGITQAIGAYHVHVNGRDIVFLDTPGHEAFTAMRARGAQVTDIVVLIVAADDGVMNQTVEAINHARVAGVPIIVAINKIDKPGADPEKIKQALTEHNLLSEQWGGDTIFCEVSAKKKINIEELLEMILLQADVMELKADPDRPVRGIIIESKLDKGRGPVATVLIQEGTLRESDSFVSKTEFGRVRALINDQGRRIKEAGPSMPVEVIGFSSVPQTGAEFFCVDDEKKARAIADYWTRKAREKELSSLSKITLEQLYQRIKEGAKEFNVIVKADVQGSIEAISDALNKLSTDDIKLKIIHSSTGAISETDVMLASASQAIIIGFNVRPDARVVDVAQREGVEIKLYDIIYNVIADVRAAMEGLLEPEYREVVQGRAEVRELFKVPKVGTIAGCYVTDGKIMRSNNLKLVRDSVVVFDGKILSLKRFKDDAREVLAGFECGIGIEGFNDIHPGDVIEAYAIETLEKKLEPNADKR